MSDSAGQNFAYLGKQDASSNVTDINAIRFLIRQELATVRTSIPVQVVKAPYDAEGNVLTPGTPSSIGFIDVQPLVNQLDGYGNSTLHGTIFKVSYHRYQGGYGAVICDPTVNGVGTLVVADRDTSSVRQTGTIANPGSRRKFDLADGVFHGAPIAGPPSQFVSFYEKGLKVQDNCGNIIATGTAGMVITAPRGCVINGCTITGAGDVITPLGVDLNTHVHTEVTTGGDDTGPPA